ncbi:hypothetical protein ROJ8625_02419 [Roseivivax jejudonensis]|uniref:Uncharacterized protein n=1 Tax=Roseivivax jejudonensis TaxID=1529041 RepID=A0A1X6ZGL7_9RHOB|nr:hypothetical protein [Roseivivax jejudonensis]SLN49194.1 hypothetical protein ROJ8625_02419 [Roseivivax jejudonensis]
MRTTHLFAAAAATFLSAGVVAADDAWRGDATNEPNSTFLVHVYPGVANHCPHGLQPVSLGGMVSCGTPTAGPYVNRAGGHAHAPAPTRAAPPAPAPALVEGRKGIIYR